MRKRQEEEIERLREIRKMKEIEANLCAPIDSLEGL